MFGRFSGTMTVSDRRFGIVQRGVCAVQVPWQPSFGAAEDRNADLQRRLDGVAGWQPSFGAAEDRNACRHEVSRLASVWQPSFGAAEDRNYR